MYTILSSISMTSFLGFNLFILYICTITNEISLVMILFYPNQKIYNNSHITRTIELDFYGKIHYFIKQIYF